MTQQEIPIPIGRRQRPTFFSATLAGWGPVLPANWRFAATEIMMQSKLDSCEARQGVGGRSFGEWAFLAQGVKGQTG